MFHGDSGNILYDGTDIARISPEMRKIGLVYQSHALFPHMKVWENIAYGLKMRGASKEEQLQTADHLMELLSITHIKNQYPGVLSGGESQRTASYAGIKVERVIVRTMVLSGAVCGLMGLLLTAGTDHTLTTTIVGGRGFTAVMVSWMAKFNPIIMIFTSLLLVVLGRGASEISSTFGLNQSFSDILTGIILFFIIGSEFFITYRVSLRKGGKKEA